MRTDTAFLNHFQSYCCLITFHAAAQCTQNTYTRYSHCASILTVSLLQKRCIHGCPFNNKGTTLLKTNYIICTLSLSLCLIPCFALRKIKIYIESCIWHLNQNHRREVSGLRYQRTLPGISVSDDC